ncbi:unnamed protein product [Rodentolepis nana]|uniref:Inhibitor_I29 domain-containing protein n=1 Tax=Rodentolepis nana TaxID=102285 RepID=A0A0R3TDC2_RODNA|nr:unnamed protein product [Rodentolepis nana]
MVAPRRRNQPLDAEQHDAKTTNQSDWPRDVTIAQNTEIDKAWFTWKLQRHPNYENKEDEEYRKYIFSINLHYIKGQHKRYKAGLESYMTKLNQFANLTFLEFADRFLGTKPQKMALGKPAKPWISSFALKDLPDTVDWRDKNLVTEIKNQGVLR